MSAELTTLFLAMAPLLEFRVAFPVAVGIYDLPFGTAYLYSVLGNLVPAVLLVFALYRLSDWLMRRSPVADRFLKKLFQYTRRKHENHFEKFNTANNSRFSFLGRNFLLAIALFIFVAVPLPLTGVWSGAIAAFVFGLPLRHAVFALSLGVLASGLIVAGLFGAGIYAWNIL